MNWTSDVEEAFELCKKELLNVTALSHPAPAIPLILICDASDFAVGVLLEQVIDGVNKSIFFSRRN